MHTLLIVTEADEGMGHVVHWTGFVAQAIERGYQVHIAVTATLVLFNADGIKTGTGWVAGDDGWLALDRDGNGLIDSGRELFGADTVLSGTPGVDAVYATTGFEALKALDSNGDNVFNAADTAFGQVRIWQDANQDGVSQYNELFTLAQKNIASINLNASTTTQNLGNGNVVSGTATVTRTNGTTTLAETVGVAADTTAANLQLGSNPFYRDFTDTVVLSTQAQGLPDMHGSGWVRDLREAMSQGDTYGQALANKVAQFAQATTKEAQMALLDDVIGMWSATNSVWPGMVLTRMKAYLDSVEDSGAIKNIAGCARSIRAYGRFGYESIALPLSSGQTLCSPNLPQYGSRCARSGFSRRALRHQYRCSVGQTQKTSSL